MVRFGDARPTRPKKRATYFLLPLGAGLAGAAAAVFNYLAARPMACAHGEHDATPPDLTNPLPLIDETRVGVTLRRDHPGNARARLRARKMLAFMSRHQPPREAASAACRC